MYLNALGVEIIAGSPYTKTYAETMPNRVLREKPTSGGFDQMSEEESNGRTRMLTKELMIVGDIILTHEGWYLFTGEGILNTQTGENLPLSWLELLLTYETFVTLRPSLISDL